MTTDSNCRSSKQNLAATVVRVLKTCFRRWLTQSNQYQVDCLITKWPMTQITQNQNMWLQLLRGSQFPYQCLPQRLTTTQKNSVHLDCILSKECFYGLIYFRKKSINVCMNHSSSNNSVKVNRFKHNINYQLFPQLLQYAHSHYSVIFYACCQVQKII